MTFFLSNTKTGSFYYQSKHLLIAFFYQTSGTSIGSSFSNVVVDSFIKPFETWALDFSQYEPKILVHRIDYSFTSLVDFYFRLSLNILIVGTPIFNSMDVFS